MSDELHGHCFDDVDEAIKVVIDHACKLGYDVYVNSAQEKEKQIACRTAQSLLEGDKSRCRYEVKIKQQRNKHWMVSVIEDFHNHEASAEMIHKAATLAEGSRAALNKAMGKDDTAEEEIEDVEQETHITAGERKQSKADLSLMPKSTPASFLKPNLDQASTVLVSLAAIPFTELFPPVKELLDANCIDRLQDLFDKSRYILWLADQPQVHEDQGKAKDAGSHKSKSLDLDLNAASIVKRLIFTSTPAILLSMTQQPADICCALKPRVELFRDAVQQKRPDLPTLVTIPHIKLLNTLEHLGDLPWGIMRAIFQNQVEPEVKHELQLSLVALSRMLS